MAREANLVRGPNRTSQFDSLPTTVDIALAGPHDSTWSQVKASCSCARGPHRAKLGSNSATPKVAVDSPREVLAADTPLGATMGSVCGAQRFTVEYVMSLH